MKVWENRVEIEIGDVLLTPHGEMSIVEIDNMSQQIFTRMGRSGIVLRWRQEDLEVLPTPADMSNLEAVNQWLRCVARVVPGVEVNLQTIRCLETCGCAFCYRVERRYGTIGGASHASVEVTHMLDSNVCRCRHQRCRCTANTWTANGFV